MKGKTHDLNYDLKFSAQTINFVCHSIRSMFRYLVYILYNFWVNPKMTLWLFRNSVFYYITLRMRINIKRTSCFALNHQKGKWKKAIHFRIKSHTLIQHFNRRKLPNANPNWYELRKQKKCST